MAGNYRSGRRPSGDALRVVQGGKGGAGKVTLTPGLPEPPEDLADDVLALRYFKRIGGYLQGQGKMAHEYADGLATLAQVCADYCRTREQYRTMQGKAFHTEKRGERVVLVEAPILKRLAALAVLRVRLLGEFGLTPVTASKVFATGAEPGGKWDRLIGGR